MGSCTSCSLSVFSPEALSVDQGRTVAILFTGDVDRDTLSRFAKKGIILKDNGVVENLINPIWHPRVFTVDSASRLVWISKAPNDLPGGVSVAN